MEGMVTLDAMNVYGGRGETEVFLHLRGRDLTWSIIK
jgi:hypothetical protein